MDADLRKGVLHQLSGSARAFPGVAEILSGRTQRCCEHGSSEEQTVAAAQSVSGLRRRPLKALSPDTAPGWASLVQPTEVSNLWLLPCGKQAETDGELFMSAALTGFLEEAASVYDFVIIDTPPVMAADDATSLAPRIDGVLFVLRAGHTFRRVWPAPRWTCSTCAKPVCWACSSMPFGPGMPTIVITITSTMPGGAAVDMAVSRNSSVFMSPTNPPTAAAAGVPCPVHETERPVTSQPQNQCLTGDCEQHWYCLRAQSKREHIASHWLTLQLELETYLPRIRFRRVESRGPVWTTEALFPNYLFARFDLGASGQQVERVPGVIEIVRFGSHCPPVPEPVIEELRRQVGADQVHVLQERFVPGDAVQIESGPFEGLGAVVTRVMPAKERVSVLLELLGRQANLELPTGVVRSARGIRQGLFTENESDR